MKQYASIKAKYPDALLLFRVGDFYETFGEDAIKTSKILGIILTRRSNGSASSTELAGFPHHAIDTYLPKLVKAGFRVAICDQLEDPKFAKGVVKRGITEIVTPGISFSDKILDHKSNNFLAGIFTDKKNTGVAFIDVTTAEFYVAQGSFEYIDKLLQSFNPSEVVIPKNIKKEFFENFGNKFYTYALDEWVYTADYANDILLKQFQTTSLKGFGIDNMNCGIIAAGSVLHYVNETQQSHLQHICKISRIEEDHFVWLDKFTARNLELFYSTNENAKTLLDVIDYTISPMGARMLKKWINLPLKDISSIEERHDITGFLLKNTEFSEMLEKSIKKTGDLERLVSKISVGKVNPREIIQLKNALYAVEKIKSECEKTKNKFLLKVAEQLNLCTIIRKKIEDEIIEEPSVIVAKGNVIRKNVSSELDELRELLFSGKDYLVTIQQREIEKTGISSLKISYNSIFGYYLEVRNTHKDKVPPEWIRKQTLANAERYVTEELKHYEEKILGAEEKIVALETKIFNEMVLSIADYIQPIQINASLIANLDCLLSFAFVARKYNYTRPQINESKIIDIKEGRHPVIEQQLPLGEQYIANDIFLDTDTQQIIILTGPNMSGKSALLRQTALIVLLAQIGSYVPAKSAKIGIVDKIFTRVGASDNISSGESTFMVEMTETASILNNLSERSLILLDEIGRGTSTYDGVSIAWAIAEYLHEHPHRAKTLFATHYHELNEMEQSFQRIKNYNISIREVENKIIFLRKLIPGGSEHSFGIHVAKMAGVPEYVLKRANEILKHLEKEHSSDSLTGKEKIDNKNYQLSFVQLNDPLMEQIRDDILKTDVNTLTPVEALLKLNEIKKLVGGEKK
ncbi:MAG: DNA mismatch repair protein MutS [Bacteroidales bacterium]|nr:DNA mismatch repair protein MutS [Bacteroidales bacterium]